MAKLGLFLLLVFITINAKAEVYKYIDKNGQVHFTDRRAAQGNSEQVKLPPINSIKSPKITQRNRTTGSNIPGRQQSIVMYSAEWCGVCKKAKKYFNARRIPYKELDIDKNKQARREFQMLGGKGVPLILVGDHRMAGFDQRFFDRWRTN